MHDQKFPDGNDRTPNDPCVLLSAASVKRIYNKDEDVDLSKLGYPIGSQVSINAFIEIAAKQHNWDSFEFINGQVLLKKDLKVRLPEEPSALQTSLYVTSKVSDETTLLVTIEGDETSKKQLMGRFTGFLSDSKFTDLNQIQENGQIVNIRDTRRFVLDSISKLQNKRIVFKG
jgi:hypothetical protein